MPDVKMEESSFKVYYDKLYQQHPEVKFPIFQLPFQQNKLFTGREIQLNKISEYLSAQSTVAITSSNNSQTQTVVGLGGVGKTQLVIEYAYQAQTQNIYQIIWFLNGHDLDASYLMLAAQLKVYGDSKEEVIEQTKHKLQQLGNYLLVIDDAEDYESIKNYLPPTGNNGHVLITTRHKSHWQQMLELGVFDLETEALPYFKKFIDYPITDQDKAIYLVDTLLGRLPLALTQAGAFIKRTGITIGKYIEYFETQIKTLWGEEKQPEDYADTIAVTWNITLNKIKEAYPQAEDLLCGMSFLAPGPNIIKESWLSGVVDDELNRREGLGELVIYSMLDEQATGHTVHQLVQEVIFTNLSVEKKQSYFEQIYKILTTIYPYKPTIEQKSKDYTLQYQLLPHLETLLHRLAESQNKWAVTNLNTVRDQELKQSDLLDLLADGYGNPHLGNNAQKKKTLLELALVINEKHYGPEHPEVAIILINLGNAYGELGGTQKQKTLLERALVILEKHYGPEHPEIAATLVNLSNAYGDLGNVQKQKTLLERALVIKEKHYGSEHPEVAIILGNLGNAYGDLGDAQTQKTLLEQALVIDEKHYGPEHPQVAKTLNNLSNAYSVLGDAQKQKTLLERALVIDEKHYGPEHPRVAKMLGNLGTAYGALGDAQKQKRLLERALFIEEKHYGPEHPEVALTLTNLGSAYGDFGDAQKKKTLLERALVILEKHYGPEHPEVAITLLNLGNAYGALGDAQTQKTLLERALVIDEKHYGPEHPEIAIALGSLGNAYGALGDAQKKKTLLERALRIKEKHYGPEHPQVAKMLVNLGNAYGALGDAQKKKTLLERALVIEEKHYGPEHPEVAITLLNLGNAYGALGDAQTQKTLLERALRIKEKHYGPEHPEIAKTLGNLGIAYGALGDAQKKKTLLERALMIKEKHYGPKHPEVAITLGNLTAAYGALKQWSEVKVAAERAYQIFLMHPDTGPEHPQTRQAKRKLEAARQILANLPFEKLALDAPTQYLQSSHSFVIYFSSSQQLKKQLILKPTDTSLQKQLLKALYSENSLKEALGICEKLLKTEKADPEVWHWSARLNWLHPSALNTNNDTASLTEFYFANALSLKPTAIIFCEYGLYLLQSNEPKKFYFAVQAFDSAIRLLAQENAYIIFQSADKPRLDDYLQREFNYNNTLALEIIALSYYGLIQCYQGLQDDIRLVEQLELLENFVAQQNKPVLYRLLSYAHEILGDQMRADVSLAQAAELEGSTRAQPAVASLAHWLRQHGLFAQRNSTTTSASSLQAITPTFLQTDTTADAWQKEIQANEEREKQARMKQLEISDDNAMDFYDSDDANSDLNEEDLSDATSLKSSLGSS